MANLAFFASRAEMMEQARCASGSMGIPVMEMKLISTSDTVEEAKRAAENGIDIIIARGSQASLIKQYTEIPVVDIVLTGQEMGLLISQAKELLKKNDPVIGIVGYQNMFCNMQYFKQIFNVTILEYFVKFSEELPNAVDKAVSDGANLIIGGDLAIRRAQQIGVPFLFLASTQDSVNEAFRIAKMVAYARDLEKKTSAELTTLLDYSFNGIIKIDPDGKVVILNQIAKDLLNKDSSDVIGAPISSLIHEISSEMLKQVLTEGNNIHSLLLKMNNIEVAASVAPIKVKDEIHGAIISCHEIRKLEEINVKVRRELYESGCVAKYSFSLIGENSEPIRQVIETAKRYACNDAPVLISGETGTEKEMIAECIHNAGSRRQEAFVRINCSDLSIEEQQYLFHFDGHPSSPKYKHSIVNIACNGTLFLDDTECLTKQNQRLLFNIMQKKTLIREENNFSHPVNIRVIAATGQNLFALTQSGGFCSELYYLLSTLTLNIPPLCERREDISYWLSTYLRKECEQYSRCLSLTKGARDLLENYNWPGNLIQLKSFCERLVLTASKRTIDEVFVRNSLYEIYPTVFQRGGKEQIVMYQIRRLPLFRKVLKSTTETALR